MPKFPPDSIVLKLVALCAIAILLCIPLGQIDGLIQERGNSQIQASNELASTYTAQQTLIGPVLVVPYTERWMEARLDDKGKPTGLVERTRDSAHLVFPEKLVIDGNLSPQERYRGMFKVLFYQLDSKVSGHFPAFDKTKLAHTAKDSTFVVHMPMVALGVDDVRGIVGAPALSLGGETLKFGQRVPNMPDSFWLSNGVHAPMNDAAWQAFDKQQALPFDMKLVLVGQSRLAIAPVGEETTAHITSTWPSPSFGGRFLASERTVTESGFDATWRVSSLGSSAAQQVRASMQKRDLLDTFDVSIVQPLNIYSMSNRAVKYGLLFVGLTLMAAFAFELWKRLRLHPLQYALVGLSIALFFLLLIALSEKIGFMAAYAVAASASVLLLGVYFSAVLRSRGRGVGLASFVAVLYASLFGLLSSEDNALLLGALLLFTVVAGLMIATRKLDWYSLSRPSFTQANAATEVPQAAG